MIAIQRSLNRAVLAETAAFPAPQKSVIDSVYAKMVNEKLGGTSIQIGPHATAVALDGRRIESKLARRDAGARSCNLRLEETQQLAGYGGVFHPWQHSRDAVRLAAGHSIFAGPDAAPRCGVGAMAPSSDVLLSEVTNYEQLQAARLVAWAFGSSDDMVFRNDQQCRYGTALVVLDMGCLLRQMGVAPVLRCRLPLWMVVGCPRV